MKGTILTKELLFELFNKIVFNSKLKFFKIDLSSCFNNDQVSEFFYSYCKE